MVITDFSPSRQIRPPIYSLKQSKLRRRRVIRYAILYFSMFVLFIVLIVGPIIAKKFIGNIKLDVMNLQQPSNWKNNDTSASETGTAVAGGAKATASSTRGSSSSNNNRMMARMLYGY